MKILFTGFAFFVIWSFFSTWLFVDVLRHAAKKPETVMTNPEPLNTEADSLARILALMPKTLMINHEFDKVRFTPDPLFKNNLSEYKNWLEKYPASMLLVTGYTDLVGTPEYNQALGLKRAEEVVKYLEAEGFPAARIITDSKGEENAIAGYITPEERAKNRRTEISIKQ